MVCKYRIFVVIFLARVTLSLGLAFPDMSHLFYGEAEDQHLLYNFGRFYFTKKVFYPRGDHGLSPKSLESNRKIIFCLKQYGNDVLRRRFFRAFHPDRKIRADRKSSSSDTYRSQPVRPALIAAKLPFLKWTWTLSSFWYIVFLVYFPRLTFTPQWNAFIHHFRYIVISIPRK